MKTSPVLFAKAIADETRQKIMTECCCCWISVGDLAELRGSGCRCSPGGGGHRAVSSAAGSAETAGGVQFMSQAWSGSSVKYHARLGPAMMFR